MGSDPEFEVAYYTQELGKSLQRELLRQQLAQLSEGCKRRVGAEGLASEFIGPPPPFAPAERAP